MKPFDKATMKATTTRWRKQLDQHPEEFYPARYDRILGWAADHMIYEGHAENFAYGIFKDGSNYASAIVDISYARSGRKWLKLLDLHLAPELDLSMFGQAKDVTDIGWVFVAAIVGTIDLTQVHTSRVAKLYGRSSTMMEFLRGLAPLLQKVNEDWRVKLEGRWLVIQAK